MLATLNVCDCNMQVDSSAKQGKRACLASRHTKELFLYMCAPCHHATSDQDRVVGHTVGQPKANLRVQETVHPPNPSIEGDGQ